MYMRKPFRCLIVILCFLFLTSAVTYSQVNSSDSREENIDLIIEQLSVKDKLNEIAQELQEQFSQNPFGLPPEKNERMMGRFSATFDADSLLPSVYTVFHQNYDADYMESILQWLTTRSARKVHDTRKEFYTIQGIRKRIVSKYELEQDPPSTARRQIVGILAQNLSAASTETETNTIIFRALVSAFSVLSDQQSFTEEQIDGFADNYRSQIKTEIDQEITEQLLIMYHEIDNDTLRNYAAFYETETGKWLSDTTSESIISAYQSASERFLDSIRNL